MKKLLQTMAAVMLAATIVPVCADETQKREATRAEIESCSTRAGIVELGGVLTGILPMLASGIVAASKTYKTFKTYAPLSTYLAGGCAIGNAIVAGLATMMVFHLPYCLLMDHYRKIYDKESVEKIIGEGQDKVDNVLMNSLLGIPAACMAGILSVILASKIISFA